MEINDAKVVTILEGIKQNLSSAYTTYSNGNKDRDIKTAMGKVDVLLELLRK